MYTEESWHTLDELGHAAVGLGAEPFSESPAPDAGKDAMPGAARAKARLVTQTSDSAAPLSMPGGDEALHPGVHEWLRRHGPAAQRAQLADCPPPPPLEVAEEALRSGAVSGEVLLRGAGDLAGSRRAFRSQLAHVCALERLAAASLSRWLDGSADGALAVLVGRRGRWALTRGAAVLGRGPGAAAGGAGPAKLAPGAEALPAEGGEAVASPGLPLDIDLSLEAGAAAAHRLSRRQALLWVPTKAELPEVGGRNLPPMLVLRCIGRRPMRVNGASVPPGTSVHVPHASLVQVAGVSLLVLVNHAALARYAGRAAAASA